MNPGVPGPPPAQPEVAAAPACPPEMEPFKKMLRIFRNPDAVINKMRMQGFSEDDYWTYVSNTPRPGGRAPAAAAPPARPGPPPAGPPATSGPPPSRPNPMGGGGRGGLLAGIKNFNKAEGLKKDRVVKQRTPPPVSGRDKLMQDLVAKRTLKKVDRSRPKKKKVDETDTSIYAILARREALLGGGDDSSSDEGSDDWSESE